MELSQMQREHVVWADHNFPDHTAQDQILGMMEELGELSHAFLKHKQGIRSIDGELAVALIADAHADLIIFSLGVAEKIGYDLGEVLDQTWDKVKQRDWVANPETGGV